MLSPFVRIALILAFALAAVAAMAQPPDRHLTNELFVQSAFAHGYMHGYEEGFHSGDLDLQLGRRFRDVKEFKEYKKVTGYQKQYGARQLFEQGYRNGFKVAYADSYRGRSFRAVLLERQAAPLAATAANQAFDSAFQQGYIKGQTQGLADGRASSVPSDTLAKCTGPARYAKGGESDTPAQYCNAFDSGYRLGYGDGFANQYDVDVILAKR